MFQSYQFLQSVDYDQKTDQYCWEYKIIDSDFEEIGAASTSPTDNTFDYSVWFHVSVAVIDTYEKRKLFIPINLALAFKYMSNLYAYKLKTMLFLNEKYNPKYFPYAEETEKQLQRIMDMKSFW